MQRPISPARYGDYRILELVGSGGMGLVYLAVDENAGERVAIKVLPYPLAGRAEVSARFQREIRCLSLCRHPNVVNLRDSGRQEGELFYVMDYLDGADLGRVCRALPAAGSLAEAVMEASLLPAWTNGNLPEASIPAFAGVEGAAPPGRAGVLSGLAALFLEAANGLEHLHGLGIIHRDVKPGNLMVTPEGTRAILIDMGLSRVGMVSDMSLNSRSVIGTFRYMAPEQLLGSPEHVDHRADIYELGATFYEAFTNAPFLDGQTASHLIRQMRDEQPVDPCQRNPALSPELAAILLRCTRKEPGSRYQSCTELAADLRAHFCTAAPWAGQDGLPEGPPRQAAGNA